MTPQERFSQSAILWEHYLAIGGSLDPETDTQSPFFFPEDARARPIDGGAGLRVIRRGRANDTDLAFWLCELRSPELLMSLVKEQPSLAKGQLSLRPLLSLALAGDSQGLATGLIVEEQQEREADRIYWAPLRAELERLRHSN